VTDEVWRSYGHQYAAPRPTETAPSTNKHSTSLRQMQSTSYLANEPIDISALHNTDAAGPREGCRQGPSTLRAMSSLTCDSSSKPGVCLRHVAAPAQAFLTVYA